MKLLKEVKQLYPQVRLLVVSGDDNNDIWRKVNAAGGHGFVLKSEPPEMFLTLRQISLLSSPLTTRSRTCG